LGFTIPIINECCATRLYASKHFYALAPHDLFELIYTFANILAIAALPKKTFINIHGLNARRETTCTSISYPSIILPQPTSPLSQPQYGLEYYDQGTPHTNPTTPEPRSPPQQQPGTPATPSVQYLHFGKSKPDLKSRANGTRAQSLLVLLAALHTFQHRGTLRPGQRGIRLSLLPPASFKLEKDGLTCQAGF